ncbi:helix-turn-helix domain-containing protein [Brevibacterium sp. H602]|uniref:helix-turn-helix domain-containing protein n=1 Tax=Brevibacterium sp. H602 TaxID=3444316 RepID=UPI003EBB11BB
MNTTTTRNIEVAARVREALDAEGYKAVQVAEKIGVSKGQMSRLLSGKSAIKFDHLIKLGRILGMDPRRFLGLSPTTNDVLMTVPEAADMANRHPQTIRAAIYSGDLPSEQTGPGGWHQIKESDLKAWIAGVR